MERKKLEGALAMAKEARDKEVLGLMREVLVVGAAGGSRDSGVFRIIGLSRRHRRMLMLNSVLQ